MSLQTDIDRAGAIIKPIAARDAELKPILKRIEAAALKGPHLPLEDATREGRQFRAAGTGIIVPVVITADELVKSFADESPLFLAIKAAGGDKFEEFFKKSTSWETRFKDGQKFREKATELLGDAGAPFVTACVAKNAAGIPKNKIVVGWDRAEEVKIAEVAA